MSTTEHNALIRAKDAQDNSLIIYPITKAENVDGLDEQIAAATESLVKSPTTAEVGQMLAVKTVDENNAPTEWEAATLAISDISDLETALSNKADVDHKHDSTYDLKGAAENAVASAKEYTDSSVSQKSAIQIIVWGNDD